VPARAGRARFRAEIENAVQKTYRVGIIGCGRKASTIDDEQRWLTNYDVLPCSHASAYTACARTQIVAAADPDRSKLEAFGERWNVSALYSDYREMLSKESLDIVSVTTHAPLHGPATIDAARAGAKGIICEKAVAISLAEADRMIEECRSAGARLLVNYPRRYHPTYAAARKAIQGGRIGQLRAMIGCMYDALVHNGTHLFDMLRFFAGDAEWVAGAAVHAQGPDAGGFGVIGFRDGVRALVEIASMQGFELALLGTTGRIVMSPYKDGFEISEYKARRPAGEKGWFDYGGGKEAAVEEVKNPEPVKPPMLAAVEDLVESIEQGRPPRCSGEDGRAALEIALAFHTSDGRCMARVEIPMADRTLRVESR
jgi:predicted dehydrogenase